MAGPFATVVFTTRAAGEVTATLVVRPRHSGDTWRPALLEARVDGALASHIVLPLPEVLPFSIALGELAAGTHSLELRTSQDVAPSPGVALEDAHFVLAEDGDPFRDVLRNAPVLFGRTVPELGSPLQNTLTDIPILAWHEVQPRGPEGDRALRYSVLWTGEDGGTAPDEAMALWGRTTDIEWIYRVAIDADGRRLPGTAAYQGVGHRTLPFGGTLEGDRPLLQTCTDNNMVTDRVGSPLRFSFAPEVELEREVAREWLMDLHPWTYRAMAAELRREGTVRSTDPRDAAMGDPRQYLYVEVTCLAGEEAGLAVVVRVRGQDAPFRSDHGLRERAVRRAGRVRVAVKLPPGPHAADIEEVGVVRVPGRPDTGGRVEVADGAAMILGASYEPRRVLEGRWRGATLSPTAPAAGLWGRAMEAARG